MRILGGILLGLIFNLSGWACSCGAAMLCPSMSSSAQIFIGRVMGQEQGKVQFTVEQRFKGVPSDATSITAFADPLCGGGFEIGKRYVVFISRLGDQPFIPGCGMTDLVERSASTIDFLKNWASGQSQPKLRGLVVENQGESGTSIDRPASNIRPLANVEVSARAADGSTYRARTDNRGIFRIDRIPVGKYSIDASLHGYETRRNDYSVSVPENACGELNLSMSTASRIAGTILQSDGSPARNVTVELSRVENGKLGWPNSSVSNNGGRFEFRRVPLGAYVLGVNVVRGANSEVPYPPRYYPDATSSASAERIEINGPVQLDNFTLRLAERLRTRNVEISVVWWDGTPVTNGEINFEREQTRQYAREHLTRFTDDLGLIRCVVLNDGQLKVSAGSLLWQDESSPVLDREYFVVESGDTPIRLTLVISKANDKRATSKPSTMSDFNNPCI